MKAFMIHKSSSSKLLPQVPFTFEVVEPLDSDTDFNSLNSTVIKILKENLGETVFIMKDNISFTDDFDLNYFMELFNNKPHKSVDYITTGSIKVFNPIFFTDNLLWMTQFKGTQGVIYYPSCLEKLHNSGYLDSNLYCNCMGLLTVPFLTIEDSIEKSSLERETNLVNEFLNTSELDERN